MLKKEQTGEVAQLAGQRRRRPALEHVVVHHEHEDREERQRMEQIAPAHERSIDGATAYRLNPYRVADDLGELTGEVRSTRAPARMPWWLSIAGPEAADLRFHERGVAIVRPARTERVRWDEIRELRTLTRSPDLEHYRLVTRGEETHEVRIAMPSAVTAFAALHAPTLKHLLAAALAALQEGPVRFGAVLADERGLHSAFAELRWERIAEIAIQPDGDRLVVRGRDETWMEFPLADVPNPHVLIALASAARER